MKTLFVCMVSLVCGYTLAFWYNDFAIIELKYLKVLHTCECSVSNCNSTKQFHPTNGNEIYVELECSTPISLSNLLEVIKK